MSVFDSIALSEPTPQDGALRIRRALAHSFRQLEGTLDQVREIMQHHGTSAINGALGGDRAEVVALYQALKTLVEQKRPGAKVPDLPE